MSKREQSEHIPTREEIKTAIEWCSKRDSLYLSPCYSVFFRRIRILLSYIEELTIDNTKLIAVAKAHGIYSDENGQEDKEGV